MAQPISIEAPAGYAPLHAVGWASAPDGCVVVSPAEPLPVNPVRAAAGTPLAGTAPSSRVVGPFGPEIGRVVYLTLSGSWSGTVRVLRSHDGSDAKHPLTLAGQEWAVFTGNVCEAIWDESEDGTALWLDIALTGGVLAYRVAQ